MGSRCVVVAVEPVSLHPIINASLCVGCSECVKACPEKDSDVLGMVDGKVLQPAELKALSELPSKEQLRSQIVGAIQGPLSQLVSLLEAPQRELVYVLEQRGKGAESA